MDQHNYDHDRSSRPKALSSRQRLTGNASTAQGCSAPLTGLSAQTRPSRFRRLGDGVAIDKYYLNLAREYRVASELFKRGLFATITYGNKKGADVYAIGPNRTSRVRDETGARHGDDHPCGCGGRACGVGRRDEVYGVEAARSTSAPHPRLSRAGGGPPRAPSPGN